MSSIMVIATYKPKENKKEDLIQTLRNHVPTLRQLGLITEYPGTLIESSEGNIIEIFEWKSEAASAKAAEHPKLQKIISDVKSLSESVPFGQLKESGMVEGHFKRILPLRKNRVVHFEIHADDTERCAKFYEHLFSWEVYQWSNQPYWLVNTGDDGVVGINGGITKRRHPGGVYNTIQVPHINEFLHDVPKYGGQIVLPKMPIAGVGWLAYAQDTEGNVFGMMENDQSAT